MTVDEIRAVALALPRTIEGFVRGQVKFYIASAFVVPKRVAEADAAARGL